LKFDDCPDTKKIAVKYQTDGACCKYQTELVKMLNSQRAHSKLLQAPVLTVR
jgi:hypothetical protein